MKDNIKCTNIRFNMDNPVHKKAWEYLQTMDKAKFKSYTFATAIAVTEYFDRFYRLQDDPYFENREREQQFVEQIVKTVESVLKETLPQFMLTCITGFINPQTTVNIPSKTDTDTKSEDIDWDFISDS